MTRMVIAPGDYPHQNNYPGQGSEPPPTPGAPAPLASLEELSDWVREDLTAADEDTQKQALAVLRAASALVRAEAGKSWLDSNRQLLEVPYEVAVIVVQAAARVWRNPEGWIQDTTGPYTVRYSEQVGSGLYLSEDEKASLRRFRRRSPLGTMTTTREDAPDPRLLLVPTPDGPSIPWYAS